MVFLSRAIFSESVVVFFVFFLIIYSGKDLSLGSLKNSKGYVSLFLFWSQQLNVLFII